VAIKEQSVPKPKTKPAVKLKPRTDAAKTAKTKTAGKSTPAKVAATKTAPLAKNKAGKKAVAKTVGKKSTQDTKRSASESKTSEVKTKRSRAPRDLMEQYQAAGEKKRTRKVVAVALEDAKRKRLDARARELRRQIISPSDEVVQRLARSGAIVTASTSELPLRRPVSLKRRSRKWEHRCGKCGSSSKFNTAAGLCARCGTIMIRS
jgi:hypothetical protein